MSHAPIIAKLDRPVLDVPATDDTAMCCPSCLDTLTPQSACLNIGACPAADSHATRRAPGETLKHRLAPQAFTISGNVD